VKQYQASTSTWINYAGDDGTVGDYTPVLNDFWYQVSGDNGYVYAGNKWHNWNAMLHIDNATIKQDTTGLAYVNKFRTFSDALTYDIGDTVVYNENLYQCSTAITTAGAWTGDTNWVRFDDDKVNKYSDAGDFVYSHSGTTQGEIALNETEVNASDTSIPTDAAVWAALQKKADVTTSDNLDNKQTVGYGTAYAHNIAGTVTYNAGTQAVTATTGLEKTGSTVTTLADLAAALYANGYTDVTAATTGKLQVATGIYASSGDGSTVTIYNGTATYPASAYTGTDSVTVGYNTNPSTVVLKNLTDDDPLIRKSYLENFEIEGSTQTFDWTAA
jgi:hypothetical protein